MGDTHALIRAVPLFLCFVATGLGVAAIVSNEYVINILLDSELNPRRQMEEDYFFYLFKIGGWLSCFYEIGSGTETCTQIRWDCSAEPCWFRKDRSQVCLEVDVQFLPNCRAFNGMRVLVLFGTFLQMCAFVLLFTWLCADKGVFPNTAGSIGGVGSILMLVAYILAKRTLSAQQGLLSISSLGWSYYCLAIAWAPGLVASLMIAVLSLLKKRSLRLWSYGNRGRRNRFDAEEAEFGRDDDDDDSD
mmetsp:Transcript_12428/g.37917  ORF Transcript_12428/g.37917 Transcript_12428/m.37917 type:complete len:246 (+) Transcript_12428:61-798(+)